MAAHLEVEPVSTHVIRVAVPAQTLPPLDTTNTYIIHSHGKAIVVDCASSEQAIVDAVDEIIQSYDIHQVVAYIATHYHPDHTQGLPILQSKRSAPIYLHPFDAKKLPREANWIPTWFSQQTDETNAWQLDDVRVEVMHKPGHTHGHIHIAVQPDNVLLVGDHMAGASSVWIGPPDGHMGDYFQALLHIRNSNVTRVLPGHGPIIDNPQQASDALLAHRMSREAQICELLTSSRHTLDELVDAIYADRNLGPARPWARRTIQAHLEHLIEQGAIHKASIAPEYQMYYYISH